MVPDSRRIDLSNGYDVVQARQCARQMARELGFGLTDQTRIATAVSEVARQTLIKQGQGCFFFATVVSSDRRGMECTCSGAEWLQASTAPFDQVLGGVERLMDEFELEPHNGDDVVIVMRKWLK